MVGANLPSPLLPNLVVSVLVWSSHPASAISRIRITPLFLTGWLLIVTGGLIRFLCYRALGSLFTFELSIRKDHKLITSGPYSIVRHPSYSGSIMIVLGYTICYLSSGSWLTECSGLSLDGTVGRLLVSGWVTSVVCGISSFFPRMKKEDDMLRVKFRDWNEWAKKVPYKLIPLVY
jgi:protein-S-isoprenylcysteine O-methyltransferase Ste14